MTLGMPAMSGLWCDFYACWEDNIAETINYMLSLHGSDFPNTCCVGFTVIKNDNLYKIYPKVAYKDDEVLVIDYHTGKRYRYIQEQLIEVEP